MAKSRFKLTYAESYTAPGLKIKAHLLPTLPSATAGFHVVEAYVLKAGALVHPDGRKLEFQDVRILLTDEA